MEMGSREVEKLLGAKLGDTGLDPQRTLAFRGRLDRLRKLGCPTGVRTGKGRAATYGWTQVVQLSLALDLINLGLTPDYAAEVATGEWHLVGLLCHRLNHLIGSPTAFERAVQDEKWPLPKSIFLLINVGALSHFKQGGSLASHAIDFQEGKKIMEWIRSASPYEAANILIDLGTRLALLLKLVALWTRADIADVVADFSEWAEQHVNP